MADIKDCPNCGGTHYGSIVCPYSVEDLARMNAPEPLMAEKLDITQADLISRLCELHQRFTRSRFDHSHRPVRVEVGLNDARTLLDAMLFMERHRLASPPLPEDRIVEKVARATNQIRCWTHEIRDPACPICRSEFAAIQSSHLQASPNE